MQHLIQVVVDTVLGCDLSVSMALHDTGKRVRLSGKQVRVFQATQEQGGGPGVASLVQKQVNRFANHFTDFREPLCLLCYEEFFPASLYLCEKYRLALFHQYG